MEIGDKVRIDGSQEIGILQKKLIKCNRVFWTVKFDTQVTNYPESYLIPYTEEIIYDFPTLISKNIFSPVVDVRREITKIRLNGNLNDMLYSMDTTNTDFYAYQFKPVVKIINSSSNSVLVADEVGLGKTIEAGLIWTELRQRYNFKKLLIVCPGILREKWKNELRKKFGVKAEIVGAKDFLENAKREDEFALICSRQGLVTRGKNERKNNIEENIKDKGNLVRQTLADLADKGEKLFDLLIVDEAHYLRNPETQIFKIAQSLRELSEYAVFLSATPIQNKSDDLFSLVSLLDSVNFNRQYTRNSFDEILKINSPLVKLRDGLLSEKLDKKNVLELIEEVHKNDVLDLFKDSRQLASVKREIEKNNSISPEQLHHFAYEIDSINSLGYIISRTRKRDIQEYRVIREAIPEEIQMTNEEMSVYNSVSETIRRYAQQIGDEGISKFLLCMPQRMMSSCIYASVSLWKKRSNETFYDDCDNDIDKLEVTEFMYKIYKTVENIQDFQTLYDKDTKYNRLLEVLNKIKKTYPNDKVVLFSSFVSTLEYLQKRLAEDGIESCLISGKVKNKDEILEQFETDEAKKILLASEVGSEGVDLQFCRMLINYDLPWNPMRVKQRIGRLDRIGQKNSKILIWNMFHDTTIDDKIYHKLYEKLEICTSSLGDFEIILGEMFKKLSVDLLSLSPEEQDRQIEQTKTAIKNKEEQNNRLEAEASELTAYGDYVLQQIQKAKDEENIIKPEDIANYVIDTLSKVYKNTRYQKCNTENKYQITVESHFRVAFEEFCRQNGISTHNLLLNNYNEVTCLFTNNAILSKKANIEIINQFHPIIKFLQHIDTKCKMPPTSVIRVEDNNDKGFYIIEASLITVKGIVPFEKLLFNGICVDNLKNIDSSRAKRILLKALNKGRIWSERSGLDYSQLGKIAEEITIENSCIYERTIEDIENQNFDKIEIQKNTLNRHLEMKARQLEETKQKLISNHNEGLIKATEGKFAILKQRIEDRLLKLESNKNIKPQKTDVCMVLVKVV